METLWERSQKNVMITAHGGYNSGMMSFNSIIGFEAAVQARISWSWMRSAPRKESFTISIPAQKWPCFTRPVTCVR